MITNITNPGRGRLLSPCSGIAGRRVFRAVFMLCLLFMLSSCEAPPYNVPAQMPEVVKIVFVAPLSGAASREGLPARNAFLMAIEQVNAEGSFPYYIETIVLEEIPDAALMRERLTDILNRQDIFLVCGYWFSDNAANAIPALAEKNVPLLIWGAAGTDIEDAGYVNRVCPSAAQETELLYNFCLANHAEKLDKMFIIDDKSLYGQKNAALLNGILAEEGRTALGTFSLESDIEQNNFDRVIAALALSPPSLIYYCGLSQHLPGLRSALADAGMADIFFVTPSVLLSAASGIDTANLFEGVCAVKYTSDTAIVPGTAFLELYEAQDFAETCGIYTGYAYDTAGVILAALKQTEGIPSPERLGMAIDAIRCEGVMGLIAFDAVGQAADYASLCRVCIMQGGVWTEQAMDAAR